MSVEIADAKPEDAKGVAKMLYKTWLATYPNKEAGISVEDIEDFFKRFLTKGALEKRRKDIQNIPPNQKYIVAKDGNKIIGTCKMIRKDSKNQLKLIYVLPKYQGRGIGRKMWEAAVSFADSNKDIYVEVADYNVGAIAFYEKLGFKKTGKTFKDERFRMKSGAGNV